MVVYPNAFRLQSKKFKNKPIISKLHPVMMSSQTAYENINESYNTAAPSMKLGVLLLNLGGPESQDDVEGFL